MTECMTEHMTEHMTDNLSENKTEYMGKCMNKNKTEYMSEYITECMSGCMTDEELQKLISEVEKNDLVKAPFYIEKKVFDEIDKVKQIAEYKRFRNRVMISIAAIIVFSSLIPLWGKILPSNIYRTYYISEKLNTGILTSREDYENAANEKKPGSETKGNAGNEKMPGTEIKENAGNEKKPGSETKDDVLDDEDISKFGNSHYISNLLNKRED